MTAGLIGIDWGSTNLRAFRFTEGGEVAETRHAAQGAASLVPEDFERVLGETVGDWCGGGARIVLAGMVGSRGGWREAPYLRCPASGAALADAALAIDSAFGRCFIVPGLCVTREGGVSDVMRGEETQIVGAGLDEGRAVLPGTHSKWATIARGAVADFSTVMTGELFALLKSHSVLGKLIPETAVEDDAAFALGADRALQGDGLPPLLFSARADVLLGQLAAESVPGYLSGLLIGAEIAAMTRRDRAPVTLIGDSRLCGLYAHVLARAGIDVAAEIPGEAAAARGLWHMGALLR